MAIVDVVKYNGSPDVFAWKYPNSELGTWTQLIVNESQEAILFKGGKALDIFGSGRHTLNTNNIPLLSTIVNLPFGGRSPFTAEVWYINKVHSLDIKWGTSSPIQLQDPKYGIFTPVRSHGQFGIQIDNGKKFLHKLVGTLPAFGKDDIVKFFRGLYVTKVKDSISSYLVHKQISILEINAYLDELSTYMKERIEPTLDEYGITLVNFYVNDISIPDDDPGVVQLKKALAKRAEMNIIGYNYTQERSFDTLEGAANNKGTASGMMGAGLGMGMGASMGRTVVNSFGDLTNEINTGAVGTRPCPKCGAVVAKGKKFCSECGYDVDEKKKVIKCSKCSAVLDPKIKFCPECGDKYNPCPECGADLPEGAKECKECGHTIPLPCPKCGAAVLKNAKFCPECGLSLVKKCGKCNAVVEHVTKYCPECGERL